MNTVLEYLGGVEGVRRIVPLLLRFHPSLTVDALELPSDVVECLTEVIQGHMVEKLEKTNLIVCEYHNNGESYPEIRPKDLRLVDTLLYESNAVDKFGALGDEVQSFTN